MKFDLKWMIELLSKLHAGQALQWKMVGDSEDYPCLFTVGDYPYLMAPIGTPDRDGRPART